MGLQNISPNNFKKNTCHKYIPLTGTDQCNSKHSLIFLIFQFKKFAINLKFKGLILERL